MNLLSETIEALKPHTPKDVLWVGGKDFHFSWEEFAAAANVEYDEGFGAQEVATDLVVVGDGWWLERYEYDGSEYWDMKTQPSKPNEHRAPNALTVGQAIGGSCGWRDLSDLNKAEP